MTRLAPALCLLLLAAAPQDPAKDVRDLAGRVGVDRGICVLLNIPRPSFPVELAQATHLTVYVQIADRDKATAARKAADRAGLLGRRVYVEEGDAERIHLAGNLADAVVVGGGAPPAEVDRVLRPGGKAIDGDASRTKAAPEGTDEWSHPFHGPDNNPQSRDTRARGPYLTHFMSEPWYAAMPQMSVIGGGRIFKAFGNRSSAQPQWPMMNTLIALSAYNGSFLWKRPLTQGFMISRNTMIAAGDTLFFADDVSCKLIDAATGKIRDEIKAPADLSDGPVWKWMGLEDGTLYALVGAKEGRTPQVRGERFRGAGWPWWKMPSYGYGFGRTVLAIDPVSKKIRWHHREEEKLDARAMGMAGKRIFIYSHQKFLAALDKRTGKELWRSTDAKVLAAIGEHDPAQHWMKGFSATTYAKCTTKAIYFAGPQRKKIVAVSAEDGTLLWQHDGGNTQLVLRDDAVYSLGEGRRNEAKSSMKLDPLTGEVLARFPSRDRCTRATASIETIFTRGGGGGSTAVFDVTSEEPKKGLISPMRPACHDGVLVAHGHLFWGPWMCRCDGTQIGVISLAPSGGFDHGGKAQLERFVDDPTAVAGFDASDLDWPTYRRDNGRGARVDVAIADKLAPLWTFDPPGETTPTAPVAAGGLVFVGGADGTVRALDGKTGKIRWSAYTGGGMKYPPSIWNGRAYVGSGDGWIYCLEASSGKRLWRYRASPEDRRIPVYGSLLSTWPVGSGVLVEDGVAYAAAGMANYDGTHVTAIDAVTGKSRWHNGTSGHLHAERDDSGAGVQGHLLLHKGGLFMGSGNLVRLARYAISDGKFNKAGGGRGKDLYVLNGQVRASGNPLYWRPQDSHYIQAAGFPVGDRYLLVNERRVGLSTTLPDAKGNGKFSWSTNTFNENCAVAMSKDAVVVDGANHVGKGEDLKSTAGLRVIALADGRQIAKQPLPALPVGWGALVDRKGRIVISLRDGRVVCFGTERQK